MFEVISFTTDEYLLTPEPELIAEITQLFENQKSETFVKLP